MSKDNNNDIKEDLLKAGMRAITNDTIVFVEDGAVSPVQEIVSGEFHSITIALTDRGGKKVVLALPLEIAMGVQAGIAVSVHKHFSTKGNGSES